jgi:hypothetical protein
MDDNASITVVGTTCESADSGRWPGAPDTLDAPVTVDASVREDASVTVVSDANARSK